MSRFGDLIAFEGDHDDHHGWAHQLELEQRYYEEMNPIPHEYREEEMLDRRERARDIANVGKRYY